MADNALLGRWEHRELGFRVISVSSNGLVVRYRRLASGFHVTVAFEVFEALFQRPSGTPIGKFQTWMGKKDQRAYFVRAYGEHFGDRRCLLVSPGIDPVSVTPDALMDLELAESSQQPITGNVWRVKRWRGPQSEAHLVRVTKVTEGYVSYEGHLHSGHEFSGALEMGDFMAQYEIVARCELDVVPQHELPGFCETQPWADSQVKEQEQRKLVAHPDVFWGGPREGMAYESNWSRDLGRMLCAPKSAPLYPGAYAKREPSELYDRLVLVDHSSAESVSYRCIAGVLASSSRDAFDRLYEPVSLERYVVAMVFYQLALGFSAVADAMASKTGERICRKTWVKELVALCPKDLDPRGWMAVVLWANEPMGVKHKHQKHVTGIRTRSPARFAFVTTHVCGLTPRRAAILLGSMLLADSANRPHNQHLQVYQAALRQPQPVAGPWRYRKHK